jgi:glutaredoxin 3
MADKQVTIYSTPTCPYCKRAKEYLSRQGIEYTEHNVAADRKAAKEMVKRSGQLGVPVILIGDEVIVGFHQSQIDKLLAQ